MVEQVQIGPYKLEKKLGYGGMAVVYYAIDSRDEKEIALKILLPQYYNDEAFLRRFAKEGLNAQRLNHPNIVRTYAAGEDDGFHYIAMEFINGSTLEQHLIEQKPLSLLETVRVLGPIGAALDYAHGLGYVHRDLKLNNIMRSIDERYLLTDFGVSKHLSTDLSMMTGMGQSIGTPSYMSPEQARGERVTNSKSDIYSLGVIAYRLLAGQVPFSAQDPFELTHKIIFYEPLDPRRFNPKITDVATKALMTALAKEPADRPDSCREFIDLLSGLAKEEKKTGFRMNPAKLFRSDRHSKTKRRNKNDLLELNPEVLIRPAPAKQPKPIHRMPQETSPRTEQTSSGERAADTPQSRKQFAAKINAEHVHALRTEVYSEITQPGHVVTTHGRAEQDENNDANVIEQAGMYELTRPATMGVEMTARIDNDADAALQIKSTSPQPHVPKKFIPGEPLPGQPQRPRRKRKTTVLTKGIRPDAVYADFREESMHSAVERERIEQLTISGGYYGSHDWLSASSATQPRSWLTRLDDMITWLYRLVEPITRRFRKGYNLD